MEQSAMIKDGKKKPRTVKVKKELPSGKTIIFNVIDQPPDAKSSKWELVVAVICSGKQWQFKQGFPFEVCHAHDLPRCLGFCPYCPYCYAPLPQN